MNFQEETNDAIALLQQLIAIPSFSREEKSVADFLERFIEINGFVVTRKENNIWMLSPGFDSSRPTILLNSHIDTVKPVSGWIKDPFSPIIEENKLYGTAEPNQQDQTASGDQNTGGDNAGTNGGL